MCLIIYFGFFYPSSHFWQLFPYIKNLSQSKRRVWEFLSKQMVFRSRKLYRYIGSLSVPPCSEGVIRTVVKKVVLVSMPISCNTYCCLHFFCLLTLSLFISCRLGLFQGSKCNCWDRDVADDASPHLLHKNCFKIFYICCNIKVLFFI